MDSQRPRSGDKLTTGVHCDQEKGWLWRCKTGKSRDYRVRIKGPGSGSRPSAERVSISGRNFGEDARHPKAGEKRSCWDETSGRNVNWRPLYWVCGGGAGASSSSSSSGRVLVEQCAQTELSLADFAALARQGSMRPVAGMRRPLYWRLCGGVWERHHRRVRQEGFCLRATYSN